MLTTEKNSLARQSLAHKFGIPRQVLDEAANAAYTYLVTDCLDQAIEVARGLVAADAGNWYFRELLATALWRQGENRKALAVIDEGLGHTPGIASLTSLRASISAAVGFTSGARSVTAGSGAASTATGAGAPLAKAVAEEELDLSWTRMVVRA
jgi:hypothetical protein